jgi:predicted transcriptional regulator of viral defense system
MQMKPADRIRASAYVAGLTTQGRYHFRSQDAQKALGVSPAAAKLALLRLAKQGLIASPARGFYIIIPPEYRSLKSLPADQFVPALMQSLGLKYYAGLLTAAQYHGAAHHRPQIFQVMVGKSRRPIVSGSVRVAFIVRKNIEEIEVQSFNTPRGTILVSTPEATAVDLVGYPEQIGGLDQTATVLSELAEKLDPKKLAAAAKTAPVPCAQRLGYFLENFGGADRVGPLKAYVQEHAEQTAILLPKAPHKSAKRNDDWKLIVNAEVEAEL